MKSNNKFKGKVFMLPMLTVIEPIVPGVPMMLFCTKVKKFGIHNLSELSFGQLLELPVQRQ